MLPYGTSKERMNLKNHFIKTHLGFVSAAFCEHCLDSVLNELFLKKPIDRYYKHNKELMGLRSVIMFLLLLLF